MNGPLSTRRTTPDGSLTLNGDMYVPLSTYQAELDENGKLRRTLALAHMHLALHGDAETAQKIIERDTGDTIDSARAVADVIAWAMSAAKPTDLDPVSQHRTQGHGSGKQDPASKGARA